MGLEFYFSRHKLCNLGNLHRIFCCIWYHKVAILMENYENTGTVNLKYLHNDFFNINEILNFCPKIFTTLPMLELYLNLHFYLKKSYKYSFYETKSKNNVFISLKLSSCFGIVFKKNCMFNKCFLSIVLG